jgi:hypothetical protein
MGRSSRKNNAAGPIGREAIERYLRLVGRYLVERNLTGEILLVGGAYMTLVLR